MNILLDTCTFLWIANDAKELSTQAKKLYQNTDNLIFLSSVSVWEIVVKNKLGKLPLPEKPEIFIDKICKTYFIEIISLDIDAIFHLINLPDFHRDPFDRMLICQAIDQDLILLTSDELIIQYPVKTAW